MHASTMHCVSISVTLTCMITYSLKNFWLLIKRVLRSPPPPGLDIYRAGRGGATELHTAAHSSDHSSNVPPAARNRHISQTSDWARLEKRYYWNLSARRLKVTRVLKNRMHTLQVRAWKGNKVKPYYFCSTAFDYTTRLYNI